MFNKRRQTIEETIHVTFDESRLANPIADPTPSASIPDGFDEQTAFPQDHPPSVIAAEPLSQVAPTTSEAECSTSSEDLNNLQSESAPLLEHNPNFCTHS